MKKILISTGILSLISSAACLSATVVPVDVLVVGGGTGGVTAAMAAAQNGAQTVLIEETPWIGGQFTSQGLPASDEHGYIENTASRSFSFFRTLVRNQFLSAYKRSKSSYNFHEVFDPGNSWVSHLTHTPESARIALDQLLKPVVDTGRLKIVPNTRATAVTKTDDGKRVATVTAETVDESGTTVTTVYAPKYIVEATLLGDFLELAGVPFSVGIESHAQTGEPAAYPGDPDTKGNQCFTFCYIVEYCPNTNNTIAKPPLYDHFKKHYSLNGYPFRHTTPEKVNGFWQYRRCLAAAQFDDPLIKNDLAIINWGSNDYAERDLISATPAEREEIRNEGKQMSLGFLYWLQTECPRDPEDGGGKGYPELKLRTDLLGTSDGLAMEPYIRESRRIKALTTIKQNDITSQPTVRAKLYDDAVATGLYFSIDIHSCVGDAKRPLKPKHPGSKATKPFQIPLGALIPQGGSNVLAGQKNIGVTHLSNGSTRLHPVEWEIGEAAGTVAAMAVKINKTPEEIRADKKLLRELQHTLIRQGQPIFWYIDLPWDDTAFQGAQRLAIDEGWYPSTKHSNFLPNNALAKKDLEKLRKIEGLGDLTTTCSHRYAAIKYMQTKTPEEEIKD